MNDSLIDSPSPLLTNPGSEGYLCILLPCDDEYTACLADKKEFLSPVEYLELRKSELQGYKGEEIEDNGMPEKQRGPAISVKQMSYT